MSRNVKKIIVTEKKEGGVTTFTVEKFFDGGFKKIVGHYATWLDASDASLKHAIAHDVMMCQADLIR